MSPNTRWIVGALAAALCVAPALADTSSSTESKTEKKTTYGSSTTSGTGTSATAPDATDRTSGVSGSATGPGSASTGSSMNPPNTDTSAGRTANPDTAATASPDRSASTAKGGEAEKTLAKLHAGNQMEIQAGQLMEERAQNSKVKDFAKKMVKDHGAMDQDVMDLAKKKGIDLASASSAETQKHEEHLSSMKDMSGAQLDRHYMQMMVQDHRKDVSEVKSAEQRAKSSDEDLAKLLSKADKKMSDHLKDAQKIERDLTSRQARNPRQ